MHPGTFSAGPELRICFGLWKVQDNRKLKLLIVTAIVGWIVHWHWLSFQYILSASEIANTILRLMASTTLLCPGKTSAPIRACGWVGTWWPGEWGTNTQQFLVSYGLQNDLIYQYAWNSSSRFFFKQLWYAFPWPAILFGPTSSQLLTLFGPHGCCAAARRHVAGPPPSQRDFGQALGERPSLEAEDAWPRVSPFDPLDSEP